MELIYIKANYVPQRSDGISRRARTALRSLIAANVHLLPTVRNRVPAEPRNRFLAGCQRRADPMTPRGLRHAKGRALNAVISDVMRFGATDGVRHFGTVAVFANFCSGRRSFSHRTGVPIAGRSGERAARGLR